MSTTSECYVDIYSIWSYVQPFDTLFQHYGSVVHKLGALSGELRASQSMILTRSHKSAYTLSRSAASCLLRCSLQLRPHTSSLATSNHIFLQKESSQPFYM